MDRIGKVASGMHSGCIEQGVHMPVPRGAFACDARKLGFGGTDLNSIE
jgi:hypothetical protein